MQGHIRAVHQENTENQHDFQVEDHIGVFCGPAFQLGFLEAGDVQDVTAHQKDNRSNEGKDRKHLDKADDEHIAPAQERSEEAVRTENTVYEYFDQFDLGDDEGDINK